MAYGEAIREAWIVGAVRTPIGRHGGALAAVRPDDLRAVALEALMERADPSLARAAFEETIRFETLVQVFSRAATRHTELAGTEVAKDDRVMISSGAANRDPRRWEDPDRFDVTRKASGHLAFGLGIHGCVGKPVAQTEGEAVLGALARKVGRIELDGEPQRHLNNAIRRFASLPVTFYPP